MEVPALALRGAELRTAGTQSVSKKDQATAEHNLHDIWHFSTGLDSDGADEDRVVQDSEALRKAWYLP